MEDSLYENNIFFISDSLEEFIIVFKKEAQGFNFYSFFYEELHNKNFLLSANIDQSENNLFIISKSFYEKNVKNDKAALLQKKFNISNPHFLFLDNTECGKDELEQIIKKENFFYKIDGNDMKEGQSSIYFLLILIFQHIKDLSRLSDYIINSFQTIVNSELINQQKTKIEQLYKELETLSKIDILTNVMNRRAFFEALDKEMARTFRDIWRIGNIQGDDKQIETVEANESNELKEIFENIPKGKFLDHYGKLTCLMIDIDHFKEINDNYGHLAGDIVLKELGKMLMSKKIFRENDIVGRFGGEEFIIILPETNSEFSRIPADRLRKEIKKMKFDYDNKEFSITISIGISELLPTDKSSDEIIDRADKALYYAKKHGKDQVIIYEEIDGNKSA